MASILQSYEITAPDPRVQPFAHYKGKADMSGLALQPNRIMRLSFIDVANTVYGGDAEAKLNVMLGYERTFLPVNETMNVPIGISITKNPKSPISWEVSYLHPLDSPYDFIVDTMQINSESMQYDPFGILSWSLQADLEYAPFSGDGVFLGYSTKEVQVSISATTDFEIANYNDPDSIVTQGLNLSPNIHTLQSSRRITEDTSLHTVYQYQWQFGVLS